MIQTILGQSMIQLTINDQQETIKNQLRSKLFQLTGAEITDDDTSFLNLFMDSIIAVELAIFIEDSLGIALTASVAIALEYPTINRLSSELLTRLNQDSQQHSKTCHIEAESWFPLLYHQRKCYRWHFHAQNKACIQLYLTVRIRSKLNMNALEQAFHALLKRHEVLRTVYRQQGDLLLQRVVAEQSADFRRIVVGVNDWSQVAERIYASAQRPFDLEQGVLLRGHVFSKCPDDHILVFAVHHLIADATALSVLFNELFLLYKAFNNEEKAVLPVPKSQFSEFVSWQNALLAGSDGKRQESWWLNQLSGDFSKLQLPTDFPRPECDSHFAACYPLRYDPSLIDCLRQIARKQDSTLFMLLMTAFQILLYGLSKQNDILVVTSFSNRTLPQFADTVGYLSDVLPIRTQITSSSTRFSELLQNVRMTVVNAMNHQSYPAELMAEKLNLPVDNSRPVLSPVWFTLLPEHMFQGAGSLLRADIHQLEIAGLILESTDLIPAWLGNWYEIELNLIEYQDTVAGNLVYSTDLYCENTIASWMDAFQRMLEAIANNPKKTVFELTALMP
jgi:acyl carrier protein